MLWHVSARPDLGRLLLHVLLVGLCLGMSLSLGLLRLNRGLGLWHVHVWRWHTTGAYRNSDRSGTSRGLLLRELCMGRLIWRLDSVPDISEGCSRPYGGVGHSRVLFRNAIIGAVWLRRVQAGLGCVN